MLVFEDVRNGSSFAEQQELRQRKTEHKTHLSDGLVFFFTAISNAAKNRD
jgi:hypothetical protein